MAKICLQTCKLFATNIVKNPDVKKYQKLNLTNKHVDEKVGRIEGAILILEGMGFKRKADHMVMENVNMGVLKQVEETLSLELDQYEAARNKPSEGSAFEDESSLVYGYPVETLLRAGIDVDTLLLLPKDLALE